MGGTHSALKNTLSQKTETEDKTIGFVPIDKDSPGEEVFPKNIFFDANLQEIILGYVSTDFDNQTNFTLFGRNNQRLQRPREIIEKIVWSNLDADKMNHLLAYAEYLAEHDTSFLRTRIHEVKTPTGVVLKNKYFIQILCAINYFNPRKMRPDEENFGLVERFSKYLSPSEKREQIYAQLPPGEWREATSPQLIWYYNQFVEFCKDIIEIHSTKSLISEGPTGFILKLKTDGIKIDKEIIQHKISDFHETLRNPPDAEITTGLMMHPSILCRAANYIYKKFHQRFFGFDSDIGNALWAGFGVLQKMLGVGDALFVLHGIKRVDQPDHSLNKKFEEKHSVEYYYQSGLSTGCYLNSGGFLTSCYDRDMGEYMKKYFTEKDEALDDYLATLQCEIAPDFSCGLK